MSWWNKKRKSISQPLELCVIEDRIYEAVKKSIAEHPNEWSSFSDDHSFGLENESRGIVIKKIKNTKGCGFVLWCREYKSMDVKIGNPEIINKYEQLLCYAIEYRILYNLHQETPISELTKEQPV